jgi:hypothetical protein
VGIGINGRHRRLPPFRGSLFRDQGSIQRAS